MDRGQGVYRIGLPSSYKPVSTVVVYLRLLSTNDSLLCFLALRQSEIPRVDDIAMGMHIGEALDIKERFLSPRKYSEYANPSILPAAIKSESAGGAQQPLPLCDVRHSTLYMFVDICDAELY